MKSVMTQCIIAATLSSPLFAGEKTIKEQRSVKTVTVEIAQAFAEGSDADIWAQSSVSVKFKPALEIADHQVTSLGAGIEGESHSVANYLNNFFDEGPRKLEFEVVERTTLSWKTSEETCQQIDSARFKIINNPVFKIEGFKGELYDAYSTENINSAPIPWETCLAMLREK
jgi:hypothetical protein